MGLHAMDVSPVNGSGDREEAASERQPVIVVGYDGSPNARVALDYATERVGRQGKVLIAHVYGPAESWFGAPSYQPEYEDYRPLARTLTEAVERDLPERLRHEMVVRRGSPPTALLQIAAEYGADEIVVGAHGSDPTRRGLGNVPTALIEEADRPIVVIPPRAAHRLASAAAGHAGASAARRDAAEQPAGR
jgi:nucleotide-binding universal stress UspA family protein